MVDQLTDDAPSWRLGDDHDPGTADRDGGGGASVGGRRSAVLSDGGAASVAPPSTPGLVHRIDVITPKGRTFSLVFTIAREAQAWAEHQTAQGNVVNWKTFIDRRRVPRVCGIEGCKHCEAAS